jgi:sugar phosphate isomerase/epimerase
MTRLCFNAFNRSAWFGVDPQLPAQIRAAADAGFPLFGPDSFSIAAHVEQGGSVEELARACAAAGTRVFEIAALMVGVDDAEAGAREIAAYASVLGPDWVLTNVMAPVDDRVRDEFARCAEIIGETGARLAVEYLPWTPVASAGAALDLVRSVPATGARVLPDVWHHFRGPDDWAALDALPLDEIAYVQFSDALPMISEDLVEETVSRRVFPGEGEFDLGTYCDHMRAKGFDGVVSVEVLSAAMRETDLGAFTRRAYAATAPYWGVAD